jgi:hypothetical protein
MDSRHSQAATDGRGWVEGRCCGCWWRSWSEPVARRPPPGLAGSEIRWRRSQTADTDLQIDTTLRISIGRKFARCEVFRSTRLAASDSFVGTTLSQDRTSGSVLSPLRLIPARAPA